MEKLACTAFRIDQVPRPQDGWSNLLRHRSVQGFSVEVVFLQGNSEDIAVTSSFVAPAWVRKKIAVIGGLFTNGIWCTIRQ